MGMPFRPLQAFLCCSTDDPIPQNPNSLLISVSVIVLELFARELEVTALFRSTSLKYFPKIGHVTSSKLLLQVTRKNAVKRLC